MEPQRRSAVPIAPRQSCAITAPILPRNGLLHASSATPAGPISTSIPHHAPDSQDMAITVASLQASLVEMARRMDKISSELVSTRSAISAEGFRDRRNHEKKTYERIILFARMNARALLVSNSTELNRLYPNICSSNVVRQILLKSKPSDCTLQDFQIIAAAFCANPDISCSIHPSEFYARFPSSGRAARFEISFDSFADFCAALKISVHDRESGVFRIKKNRRTRGKSIQVLGVEVLKNLVTGAKERRISLAHSIKCVKQRSIPVLFQRSTAWSEGSCEYGFRLQQNASSELNQCVQATALSRDTTQRRFTDLDKVPLERRFFCLTWERVPCTSAEESTIYPEHVPGALRSVMPAVVLRSNLLTNSAEEIFETRISGVLLKQVLVSPANSSGDAE